jgi:cytosine permease
MALFRYAKRASYGFYSAFGMYLGHYLAWICAGIMGAGAAIIINRPLTELDSGSVATTALGAVGAVAVVIAGWTTSNPTIYRSGLALQIATPNWPRWLVTLLAGVITTLVACSPFVFTKLLGFVAIYGLLLMPVGAIVFIEHWLFPKIGLTQYWVSRKGELVNWPALLAWGITLAGAVLMWLLGYIHEFFLIIPVWLSTAILYTVLSAFFGAAEKLPALPEEQTPALDVTVAEAKEKAKPSKKSKVYYITGLVAVASLAVCLGMAIWVAAAKAEVYNNRLELFKDALKYLTLIYFIFGTIWICLKEKEG